jgi:hypothetical protein
LLYICARLLLYICARLLLYICALSITAHPSTPSLSLPTLLRPLSLPTLLRSLYHCSSVYALRGLLLCSKRIKSLLLHRAGRSTCWSSTTV